MSDRLSDAWLAYLAAERIPPNTIAARARVSPPNAHP